MSRGRGAWLMLQFPYQDEPLSGPAPPSLPASATVRWRPLAPVSIIGPTGQRRFFPRALLDPGADDTVFPLAIAGLVGISLRPDSRHALRWRGQGYALRFADVSLELSDGAEVWRYQHEGYVEKQLGKTRPLFCKLGVAANSSCGRYGSTSRAHRHPMCALPRNRRPALGRQGKPPSS